MLAWISNTITTPPAKKAVAIAIVNACGNIGSIPGSYIWRDHWAPNFVNSFGIELAILGLGCVCAFTLRTYLSVLNKRLELDEIEGQRTDGKAASDTGSDTLGVPNKGFRYLI
jgi:hypothetical protein